ncbi:Guanylate kinase [Acidimicrobium ferrooxidans DSM 10331]|uniref:Guanylate kinase n=1 Tax=Acidimicrobium ferrooxidans (strain DSM 10331 / JCM 15462 / NBRC 103882 / ICP) TaxID=525909 RepID=C7M0V3_ACIFD|nr:Guanylate kinase [Acidimicrobium ferrooxidans DSM 10331]
MIVVICGPGGVGKGTIARRLAGSLPSAHLARSWTTRPRRPGEGDEAYEFVSREDFESAIDQGMFVEWASFNGRLYGTPRSELERGDPTILEIDVQGARSVRMLELEAAIIGVVPPSFHELERRMRARGDDDAHVESRLAIAANEVEAMIGLADHIVVNDRLERAIDEVAGIVRGAALRPE